MPVGGQGERAGLLEDRGRKDIVHTFFIPLGKVPPSHQIEGGTTGGGKAERAGLLEDRMWKGRGRDY